MYLYNNNIGFKNYKKKRENGYLKIKFKIHMSTSNYCYVANNPFFYRLGKGSDSSSNESDSSST